MQLFWFLSPTQTFVKEKKASKIFSNSGVSLLITVQIYSFLQYRLLSYFCLNFYSLWYGPKTKENKNLEHYLFCNNTTSKFSGYIKGLG